MHIISAMLLQGVHLPNRHASEAKIIKRNMIKHGEQITTTQKLCVFSVQLPAASNLGMWGTAELSVAMSWDAIAETLLSLLQAWDMSKKYIQIGRYLLRSFSHPLAPAWIRQEAHTVASTLDFAGSLRQTHCVPLGWLNSVRWLENRLLSHTYYIHYITTHNIKWHYIRLD